MTNLRDKFIQDHLKKANRKSLTEWEQVFVKSIQVQFQSGMELTTRQYNTLKFIADK